MPGVSRSGATIMVGVALGIDRKTATEFPLFVATPTMFGAAAYDLFKNRALISNDDAAAIGVRMVAPLLAAMRIVRWMLSFVGRHGFSISGWYWIAAEIIALAILARG